MLVSYGALAYLSQGRVSETGLYDAAVNSFLFASLFAFVYSGINAVKYACRSVTQPKPEIAKQYNFKSTAELESHFTKHNQDFDYMYADAQEYLNDANYVIKNGTYVSKMNGYLKFYGTIDKEAAYAFVGMTRDGMNITTYGIRRISSLSNVSWIIRK